MRAISTIHDMFNLLGNMVFDYSDDDTYGTWYAESRLYVVHNANTGANWFVKADSPKDAIRRIKG